MVLIVYVSTTVFITKGNYIGYMFRLLNSHLQAYSLEVTSQDAVHTLGSLGVYISDIFKILKFPASQAKCIYLYKNLRPKYFTDINTLGSQSVHSIL